MKPMGLIRAGLNYGTPRYKIEKYGGHSITIIKAQIQKYEMNEDGRLEVL